MGVWGVGWGGGRERGGEMFNTWRVWRAGQQMRGWTLLGTVGCAYRSILRV